MSSRQVQDILNKPFEFKEVLLSPRERSKVQKGLAAEQLFNNSPARIEVTEFRLRELSVRLRTINNACDSGASLPNGAPITEVSLYGSRDRQYLVGPYWAVKELMAGHLPSTDPLIEELQKHPPLLDIGIANIEWFLTEVKEQKKVTNVDMEDFFNRHHRGYLHRSFPAPEWCSALKGCAKVQIWNEDIDALEKAKEALLELKAELSPPIEEVKAWENWWAPWTQEAANLIKLWEEHAHNVGVRATEVALVLYEKVRSPDTVAAEKQG